MGCSPGLKPGGLTSLRTPFSALRGGRQAGVVVCVWRAGLEPAVLHVPAGASAGPVPPGDPWGTTDEA